MSIGPPCMEPAPVATPNQPEPQVSAVPSATQSAILLVMSAALSGGLLWACYRPLALGSYLGWVSLVPFLFLVRAQAKPRFLYDCAWICGVCFFFPALEWMRHADLRMYATWTLLALYCSLYFPVALFLIRRLERSQIPLIITLPLVWAALEYLRSFLMTGFAWYFLAHTQHEVLPMIQITDLGGIYLVSFLVAAVNAFVFDCLYQRPEVRRWLNQAELAPQHCFASLDFFNRGFFAELCFRRNLILEGMALGLILAGAWGYGKYRLSQDQFVLGPTVCLLQSNLDQRIREFAATTNDGDSIQAVTKQYAELCARAVKDHNPPPDLIVWPETSYPHPWFEVSPKLSPGEIPLAWSDREIEIRNRLRELGSTYQISHLLGMTAYVLDEHGKMRHYNSGVFLNGKGSVEGRFDKMHRVPFGEYVPLKEWIPFMKALAPYEHDYSVQPGETFTRFKLGKFEFGVLICFEDTDPALARQYLCQTSDGAPVDFLVNISNDGWFDGSREHEEHLAVSRFRAIECRRSMVRAVNMGVSALIDGNGRVLKPDAPLGKPPVWVVREGARGFAELPASDWRHFKSNAGILTAQIPIDLRFSFYTTWGGNWLPIGCWLFLGASWAFALYHRRKSRNAPSILAARVSRAEGTAP